MISPGIVYLHKYTSKYLCSFGKDGKTFDA